MDAPMPQVMTLKDLADYLRMNERTVAKLAQEGKIPGFKVASQWRFLKESVDSWFERQLQRVSGAEVAGSQRTRVSEALTVDTIELNLKSRTKDGVLVEMTEMLVSKGRIQSGQVLLGALRQREQLCSTGIGRGIALLHPRQIMPEIAREPMLAIGRSGEGVDFDAVDGRKVHVFFLDIAPTERTHLAMLARLSRLLADDALLERIRGAKEPREVIESVAEAEGRLVEQ